jgi:hypothetical protein
MIVNLLFTRTHATPVDARTAGAGVLRTVNAVNKLETAAGPFWFCLYGLRPRSSAAAPREGAPARGRAGFEAGF